MGFRLFTPPDNNTSIVSIRLDRNQTRAREVLDAAGVQVSFRDKGSMIRVSPALFNTRGRDPAVSRRGEVIRVKRTRTTIETQSLATARQRRNFTYFSGGLCDLLRSDPSSLSTVSA